MAVLSTTQRLSPAADSEQGSLAMVPDDAILAELSAQLFASLPRADQRAKGDQYVRGLLTARGRKSVRNIALSVEGSAAAQRLHHFIADSPWDWKPVRQALTRYVNHTFEPYAWAIAPLVVPKSGGHSAGVARRFVPFLGQVVNSQYIVGVWVLSRRGAIPLEWQMVPATTGEAQRIAPMPEILADSVVTALGRMQKIPAAQARPLVVELLGTTLPIAVGKLIGTGLDFVTSACDQARVGLEEQRLPGVTRRWFSPGELLHLVRSSRRPVRWRDPGTGTVRTSLVACVRVELANAPASISGRPLSLMGEWSDTSDKPVSYWVTNLVHTPCADLFPLTKRSLLMRRDFDRMATEVGIMDYEGRSLSGWHRHMTLASAAHAARLQGAARSRQAPPPPLAED